MLRIERGDKRDRRACGRIGDFKAFGRFARGPMPIDIGKLAQQPAVGEAVERLMAMRAGKMRGHGRGLPVRTMREDYPSHADRETVSTP
ncbi:hypothetical protein X764_09540 [Mesorhizobium sp. LSHC440A00]|nr:hypothetical protein X764_09540 [Mesorhizobium sp. LSHC440A00]